MNETNNNKKRHSLCLTARTGGSVEGVTKVVSSSPDMLCLVTDCGGLTVSGKELKILKFDVDSGRLAFEGEIACLKYEGGKKPLLKRLFR